MKRLILSIAAGLSAALCLAAPKTVPALADLDLVGYHHRLPYEWTAERFAPHVSYTDAEGREQWLFEAFLFLEGQDVKHGKDYCITPTGVSAAQECWQDLLDFWLGPHGSVASLDSACKAAAKRIGRPPHKRYVVISVPDPVMFERFGNKGSSTTYWGSVDGRRLDFSKVEDQIAACKWYMDSARRMFAALKCKHLSFAGFYILSEELYVPYAEDPADRLNCQYKRWESIVPAVADYCHASGEGLWWIPYNMAPGYEYWKRLGFDMAWMQPGYYWSPSKPFAATVSEIRKYGMGMELELEFTCVRDEMERVGRGPDGSGRLVFTAADVPMMKERFREYLREFKAAGLYGEAPLALYSGTNTLTQLAVSPYEEDKALYRELCEFILGNPLRRTHRYYAGDASQRPFGIAADGSLSALRGADGFNYAGGAPLWRLYYNTLEEKEIQVSGEGQFPVVYEEGGVTHIRYRKLLCRGKELNISLHLTVRTDSAGAVRFGAELINNEPHTIIRELQYPLVGDLKLPAGCKLLTTHTGGQLHDDPLAKIVNVPAQTLYMKPDQKFRQYDLQYPRNAASNCFAFVGEREGLYFGSHDPSLQQTWHGLRAYPSAPGVFDRLEAGFYRYPNLFCGEKWENDASVVQPYAGDWTQTSRIYRSWADTWWEKRPVPAWVQDMTGWQRIIFKHQYGEYLRHYSDLPGRIFEAGEKAGSDAVLAFGWWKEGMDNGYPDYSPDDSQGGDAAWKEAIAEYRAKGGKLLLYFNGRLIDNASSFYRSGRGTAVCNHDNTGDEFTEHYKFTGEGTTLGYYDSRTFVVADMSKREWRDMLLGWADRAMALGANSVFYDQLGVAEEFPQWDLSREFPVPDICTGRYKAEALKEIRDHIKASDPDFALGTEWLSDCTAQYTDYSHIVEFTALPESFPEWFRYTFPEVVWSDRCVRDEVDMLRRVNNTLLKGLRNDIEVYRCRGLIDETPRYQEHLGKINAIRHRYHGLLLEGRFAYMDHFSIKGEGVVAREFDGGSRIAIVATRTEPGRAAASLSVPGYEFVEASAICQEKERKFNPGRFSLGHDDIVVFIFEKK